MVKTTVFLGMGSNVGDRKKNILSAVRKLAANGIKIIRMSSIYETEPVDYKEQRRFYNVVLKAQTVLDAPGLLMLCKKTERALGRAKTFRFGPRKIDIDILLYGKKVINTRKLKVPHPRLHKRSFALRPLCELAPKTKIPKINKTVHELNNHLSNFDIISTEAL